MDKLVKLPGNQDLSEQTWQSLRHIQDCLRELFSSHGYRVLETPILEPTELFVRKGGGEMAAEMYSFTDPGGDPVSLRPEFTSSIVRYWMEAGAAFPVPARIQYSGPVFRYAGGDGARRQFHQSGVELIGSEHPRADAEIVALACRGLAALGLEGAQMVLGDLAVHNRLLETQGLSERARVFVLSHVNQLGGGGEGLQQVRAVAQQLGLLSIDARFDNVPIEIRNVDEVQARELVHALLRQEEAGPLGQRQPEEVVDRLFRKLRGPDDPGQLENALELATELAGIKGEPTQATERARELLRSNGADSTAVDRFQEVVDLLSCEEIGATSVTVDFGLARGITYYTGTVFELTHPRVSRSLGGGGRYDGLPRALGGKEETPSLGFAYSLEEIQGAVMGDHVSREFFQGHRRILVMPTRPGVYKKALALAAELRGRGARVEIEVCGRNVAEAIAYSKATGISQVVEVGGKGGNTTHRIDS